MAKKEKPNVNFEFYIQIGNQDTFSMEEMDQKGKEEIGIRLNDTALRTIGYVPDERV